MSNYNWCHNPDCHKIETQSRVRGSGDNKVLRTIKINTNRQWNKDTIWDYFCNNNCLFQFLNKFRQEVANIRPVKEPSETPIKVIKTKEESKIPLASEQPYKDLIKFVKKLFKEYKDE